MYTYAHLLSSSKCSPYDLQVVNQCITYSGSLHPERFIVGGNATEFAATSHISFGSAFRLCSTVAWEYLLPCGLLFIAVVIYKSWPLNYLLLLMFRFLQQAAKSFVQIHTLLPVNLDFPSHRASATELWYIMISLLKSVQWHSPSKNYMKI